MARRPARAARAPRGTARAEAPLPATVLGPVPALLAGGRDADDPAALVGAFVGREVTEAAEATDAADALLADAAMAPKSWALWKVEHELVAGVRGV